MVPESYPLNTIMFFLALDFLERSGIIRSYLLNGYNFVISKFLMIFKKLFFFYFVKHVKIYIALDRHNLVTRTAFL